jgi:hypothetical protein
VRELGRGLDRRTVLVRNTTCCSCYWQVGVFQKQRREMWCLEEKCGLRQLAEGRHTIAVKCGEAWSDELVFYCLSTIIPRHCCPGSTCIVRPGPKRLPDGSRTLPSRRIFSFIDG